jgi:hypothetical protein
MRQMTTTTKKNNDTQRSNVISKGDDILSGQCLYRHESQKQITKKNTEK